MRVLFVVMSDADYSSYDFPPEDVDDGPSEEQTFDQRVGKNITLFRGSMSQQDLAHRMRAQGFKWSQATVWATEKGERPVRLSEVVALAEILDKPYDAFFLDEETAHTTTAYSEKLGEILSARGYVKSTIKRWIQTRRSVFMNVLPNEAELEKLPEHTQTQLRSIVERLEYYIEHEQITDIYEEAESEVKVEDPDEGLFD